jgi:hypothetical protein
MTHPEAAPQRFFSVPSRFRLLALGAFIALLAFAVACGGGDDDDNATENPTATGGISVTPATGTCSENVVAEPIEGNLLPIVVSSDMAVGENRFQLGLVDQEAGLPLTGATLHAQFICFDTEEGTPAFEADLEPVTLTKTYTHTHADGTIEAHEAGETGAYITYANFDRPGNWGVVITGETADGEELEGAGLTFNVLEEKFGLAVGDPAPRSVQLIASDVDDIHDIDTSLEPNENMHNMTIADAVTSGKPTVVGFATPAYCQTQICGPVKEIMDDLYGDYEGEVNFIHVEPYDVPRMRSGDCESIADCIVPAVNEWRLPNEPWLFVVDAEGNIAAAFDGIASLEEIEAALVQTLESAPAG